MAHDKQNMLVYRMTQAISAIVAKVVFRRKFLRNEIKRAKGPMVVLCNHEAALDFTTLIGATKRPMTFVVSSSFYNTLSCKKLMKSIGIIPKQQFQASVKVINKMRAAIEDGKILTIYPAGLMSEDGLSTPIPVSTYKFLQWLHSDVYAARTSGTYFCTPKWGKGIRPGRTYMDIYKIISKEDLAELTPEEIKARVDEALMFDAYREQEKLMVKYRGGDNIEGLENVLYACPHCNAEFAVRVKNKNTIYCERCGFEETSDKYGFLHKTSKVGEEIRYVSDWAKKIYTDVFERIKSGEETTLFAHSRIEMIELEEKRYVNVGEADITLTKESFTIKGVIKGEDTNLEIPISSFASLPFKPGVRIEIQDGKKTYRCVLDDGKLAMKFVNMVKCYYEMNEKAHQRALT